jgi:hypothetical protein
MSDSALLLILCLKISVLENKFVSFLFFCYTLGILLSIKSWRYRRDMSSELLAS